MRVLFGCLAVLLGAVSVLLAARYGYKGADTTVDGLISAVVFGAIALCAFIFDAAAVRLWFMRHRLGAIAIGTISAAALVVTFTNSLGAIAGRADISQAERVRVSTEIAADRAELQRLARERAAIVLRPVTAEAVAAARAAVSTAERIRLAECVNGDPRQRGPNCRARETEEQAKRDALTALLLDQAAATRAAELDAAAAAVRGRLAKADPVQNANPLGAALEALLGAGATVLTAWQQAIVAAVFELCLVGVMVIFELLGHRKVEGVAPSAEVSATGDQLRSMTDAPSPPEVAPPDRRWRQSKSSAKVSGRRLVRAFFRDHVQSTPGARVEVKALTRDLRTWGAGRDLVLPGIEDLLDDIAAICQERGIAIEVGDDQRVHCLGIRLATAHLMAVH
jgi:hypothetical protein